MNLASVLPEMFVFAGLIVLIVLMIVMVRWARNRSRGALVTGALLSVFAPDPELEKTIRLAEEAKTVQMEEDENEGQ